MSYTALYRKFRPETFRDVKGQDAIVTTLKNQIRSGRIGHAYLFCGTRGCGKTTVAKIMARAVNCEHPDEDGPCGVCPACQAIGTGSSMNVIEIDAASNNGVDNVREIRDEVRYAPTEGRYKVYIIDEVHMLSGSAFNALLKTLEEPPGYVIFILATTEPHKLPATILSRCQRYDFKRIPLDTITERLREITQAEQIEAEDAALRFIAKTADGAMRDALSLLDRCAAFYLGETLTYERVLASLGAVDTRVHAGLFRAVIAGNVTEALAVLEETLASGRDLPQFIRDFTWHIRNLLLASCTEEGKEIPGMEGEDVAALRAEAEDVPAAALIRCIRVLSELENDLKFSAQKRILAEVGLIRLCRPQMETDTESLAERIRQLENDRAHLKQELEEIARNGPAVQTADRAADGGGKPRPEKKKPVLPMAVPADIEAVAQNFRAIIRELPPLQQRLLTDAKLSLSENGSLLIVWPPDSNNQAAMEREGRKEQLIACISEQTGRQIPVEFRTLSGKTEFHDVFADLEDTVKMDIIIEEEA